LKVFLAKNEKLAYLIIMKEKLKRILKTEQVGSPLHAWALAQMKELKAQEPTAEELEIARIDVQIENRSWKRKEQNA
jgi:hypothetical protein